MYTDIHAPWVQDELRRINLDTPFVGPGASAFSGGGVVLVFLNGLRFTGSEELKLCSIDVFGDDRIRSYFAEV